MLHLNLEEVRLGEQDRSEVLRYLEYQGQELSPQLQEQIDRCIQEVNEAAKPHHLLRVFDKKKEEDLPEELSFFQGEDIRRHLAGCEQVICLAATLGAGIDMLLRRSQLSNMANALIMDSAASTLIEAYCDSIDADLRSAYQKEGKYLTYRFSPGYGDLPIDNNPPFATLLETRRIGLSVSASGIMIPRKSVTAIIGVSDRPPSAKSKSCASCNLRASCRFRKNGVTCGQ